MNPIVSIIVPVYKVENYLERCIESIINQSYRNLDIILIDDGSPDKCGYICDNYAKQDDRITVIHKENGGLSDARNRGIEIAKGQYITFVDSDDFIHYDYVLNMVDTALKLGCDVVQCGFEKGELQSFPKSKKTNSVKVYNNINIFYGRKLKITAWAKLYSKSIFFHIRFPVGKINEDEFITYKAIYGAGKIGIMSKPLYYYYQSPVSIMRGNNKVVKLDFMCAFEQRIQFFQDRNELDLVNVSRKEYAIRAMLYYVKYHSSSPEVKNILITVFRENLKDTLRSGRVSLYEKLILIGFNCCPKISTFFIQKFTKN